MPSGVFTDLTGHRFGRLVVMSRGPSDGKGATWHCVCDCGQPKLAKAKRLVEGNTRSCGCLKREANQRRFESEAMREKLSESMRKSWANGGKRAARLRQLAANPKPEPKPKAAAPATRSRFRKDAALDLAKALGVGKRR